MAPGPEFQQTSSVGTASVEPLSEEIPVVSPTVELGVSGLRRSVGIVDEEYLPQLRGRRGVQIYREMRENSPVIGALMFAFDRLLRGVEWKVSPGGSDDKQGRRKADFVEECKDDMSHTWDEFISEALTSVVYGWAFHEIVYKRRDGMDHDDPTRRSQYNDGLVGIRKMPLRAQETFLRWIFDDEGGIKAMVQLAPPRFQTVVIPIEKSLLIRTMAIKNNPEGYSLLRNAYRPWFMTKRIEEFEAIGIERDLAGMPVVKVPLEYLQAPAESNQGKTVAGMRTMVRNLRRGEQEGLIFPTDLDENGNDQFGFELLGGGGTRQFNTDQTIRRYSEQMLMSVLADFIMLGQNAGSGSYAMHTDKTGMFRAGINSINQSIADTLNKHLVPRLFKLNGWPVTDLPQFEPTNVDPPDLGQLAQLVTAMTGAGMVFFPDAEMEDFVRDAARIPLLTEKERKGRDVEEQNADLLRLAQGRFEVLQLGMQAQQMAAATAGGGQQPGQPGQQAPGGGQGAPGAGPAPTLAASAGANQPLGPRGLQGGAGPSEGPKPGKGKNPPQRPVEKRLSGKTRARVRYAASHPVTNAIIDTAAAAPPNSIPALTGRALRRRRRTGGS